MSRTKSTGGAWAACVPPSTVIRVGPPAMSSGGRTAASTSVVLPAVPTANAYSPARTGPGANVSPVDPTAAPVTAAEHTAAAASTPVRCCRCSPGLLRLARTFAIRNGRPVTIDRASDVRRTCPPPSPKLPSMSTMGCSRPDLAPPHAPSTQDAATPVAGRRSRAIGRVGSTTDRT